MLICSHMFFVLTSLEFFVYVAGGQLYMWGRVKTTGDNWMYPKPVLDLRCDSLWLSTCLILKQKEFFM
jgi:hypothetical protein